LLQLSAGEMPRFGLGLEQPPEQTGVEAG